MATWSGRGQTDVAMPTWILASALFLSPLHLALETPPTPQKTVSSVSVEETIGRLGTPAEFSAKQTSRLQTISQKFIDGDPKAIEAWTRFVRKNADVDVDAAVLFIVRVAYLEYAEDLYYYTAAVGYFNQQKRMLKDNIAEMRKDIKASPGGKEDMIPGPSLHAPKTFSEGAEPVIAGEAMLMNAAEWSKELKRWKKLRSRADKSAKAAATKLHTKMKKRKKLYRDMKRTHKALYAAAAGE